MIHIHCIIHSTAYTPKVIAKVKTHQGGHTVFLVTKSYRSIEITKGGKTETWSLWKVMRWIKSQEVATFTANFLSTIAAFLIHRLPSTTTIKWVVWGGDFYDLPQVKQHYLDDGQVASTNIKQRLGYKLITKAMRKIDCIIANPCDHGEVAKHLRLTAKQITLNFLLDISQVTPLKPIEGIGNVLIGNSDDPNNRHLTVIDQLDKMGGLKNCILPLSGVSNSYTENLKNKIAINYPSLTIDYLDHFIEESEYFDILSSCSHLAFGHLRQQGMLTLFSFLISDRVCSMQSQSPYYQYLVNEGCRLFALDRIKDHIQALEEAKSTSNKKLMSTLLSKELIAEQWEEALAFQKKPEQL